MNPKGIPCLYLATDENTAMSEVRPPRVGSPGTLAKFSTLRDLKMIDCSQAVIRRGSLKWLAMAPKEPPPKAREQGVWADVISAFSEPIVSTDTTAEYAPTQVLAETLRSANFDGIIYKSSLGPGRNVVLFDLAVADVVDRRLFKSRAIRYEFDVQKIAVRL